MQEKERDGSRKPICPLQLGRQQRPTHEGDPGGKPNPIDGFRRLCMRLGLEMKGCMLSASRCRLSRAGLAGSHARTGEIDANGLLRMLPKRHTWTKTLLK
jgi:hypothetical protein